MEPALAALEAPYLAGLDALIVADLGFAARAREEYPDLPLHASTQLNVHSSAQLGALERLGFARAVLARELSLAEIARPRAGTGSSWRRSSTEPSATGILATAS